MIRLVEGEALPPFLKGDPFGCRFWAAWEAYKEHNALRSEAFRLWRQEGSSLYLGLMDDSLILCSPQKLAVSGEDREELFTFLPVCGARRILCSSFLGAQLGIPAALWGKILQREKTEGRGGEVYPSRNMEEELPSLRKIYALLLECRSESFRPPDFEPFYLDFSHRLRHGVAFASVVYQEGKLAAVAMAPAVTEEIALLSGVAVAPLYRRRGYGTQAVEKLLEKLPSRSFCVFRAEGENEAFYTSLGFREIGAFMEISLPGAEKDR